MCQNGFSKMTDFFEKSADNSVKLAKFQVSKFFLFLARLNFVSAEFFRFSSNFSKFLKMLRIHRIITLRQILKHC
jgi:hypothetical protein